MNGKKDVQEKVIRYQILDGRIKALMKRRELLVVKMVEIETTLSSIEEIGKNKENEILLPLGSNVHVPGTLKDLKRIVVELGANIAMEEDVEEVKKILEKRKSMINEGLQATEDEIMNLSNEILRLESELRILIEKEKTEPEVG
jgi:prefoldin alpha subunit